MESVLTAIGSALSTFPKPVPLMGYSQGARLALLASLRDDPNVSRLALISGTPGIENVAQRAERLTSDTQLGRHIIEVGVEAFVDEWTAAGLTSLHRLTPETRRENVRLRLENTSEGLQRALLGYGQGVQPSVWKDLDKLKIPVLLMVGEDDEKYRDINSRMSGSIKDVELVVIPDSGHNPLVDNPEIALETVSAFLER